MNFMKKAKNRLVAIVTLAVAYVMVPGMAFADIEKKCPADAGTSQIEGLIGTIWGYGDAWGKVFMIGAFIAMFFLIWFARARTIVLIVIGGLLILLLGSEAVVAVLNSAGSC